MFVYDTQEFDNKSFFTLRNTVIHINFFCSLSFRKFTEVYRINL